MFLDSLTAILRKHRIRLQGQEEHAIVAAVATSSRSNAMAHGGVDITASADVQAFIDWDFDELWQSYIDMESTIDPQSWSALVSDIENLHRGSDQ